MKVWAEPERRQSKRIKGLAEVARLVETDPDLWTLLSDDLKARPEDPEKS